MGIRRTINQHPVVAVCVVAGVVLGVTGLFFWSREAAEPAGSDPFKSTKAFFTVDDGNSYFVDDATKLPPFKTADGKTAYRARVVRCGNGPPFVAYLERFADADRQQLQDALKRQGGGPGGGGGNSMMVMMTAGARALVKKPRTGDTGWLQFSPQTAQQYQQIITPRCPDGAPVVHVAPE